MIKEKIGQVCLVLIIAFISFALTACVTKSSSMGIMAKQSLYDRVIQSGKIRCAYVTYPPACIKDPNTGKLSGIGIDTIELVGKKLGLTIDWTEEVGWGSMIEGLQTGRYDMIASLVWTNANRAKLVSFSKPLYYSPLFVWVKKGDKRFVGHLDKINSPTVKIATIDGETAQVIADADFPKAGRLSLPQMTNLPELMLNVATGKADIAIQEPAVVNQYLKHNPGTVEAISDGKPIRVFPNCWMFGRGEFEFKAMLDTVLDEVINSGAMDKIIGKYEYAPGEIYRVGLPYQLPGQQHSL